MKPLALFVALALLSCSAGCTRLRYQQMREAAELTEIKDQALGGPSGEGGVGAIDRTKCMVEVRRALTERAKRLKLKPPYVKMGDDTMIVAMLFEQSFIQVDLRLPPRADGRLIVEQYVVAGAPDERKVPVADIFSSVEAQVKRCS